MWSVIRLLLTRYLWIFSIALFFLVGALGWLAEDFYLYYFASADEEAGTAKWIFYAALFIGLLLVSWYAGRRKTRQSSPPKDSGPGTP